MARPRNANLQKIFPSFLTRNPLHFRGFKVLKTSRPKSSIPAAFLPRPVAPPDLLLPMQTFSVVQWHQPTFYHPCRPSSLVQSHHPTFYCPSPSSSGTTRPSTAHADLLPRQVAPPDLLLPMQTFSLVQWHQPTFYYPCRPPDQIVRAVTRYAYSNSGHTLPTSKIRLPQFS